MSKHTPGPWLIDERPTIHSIYVAKFPNSIASVPHRKDGTDKANAKLIAAAPKLHDLGIETIAFLESVILHHAEPDLEMTNELWNKWRTAILETEAQ